MRHDHADKIRCTLVGSGIVNQYLVDIVAKVVTNCANDDVAFLIEQGRWFTVLVGLRDGVP